jgi:hypothetical protein
MKYLVIGNGFDLAHELKTAYIDFMNYAISRNKSLYQNYISGNNAETSIKYIENIDNPDMQLFAEKISRNIWMYYFTDLYRKNQIAGENWIDFETEISRIIEKFDKNSLNIYDYLPSLSKFKNKDEKMTMFYNFYGALYAGGVEKVENHTYKMLIENLSKDLDDVIDAFEIYLKQEVETCNVSIYSPDILQLGKIDGILTFNYTATAQRVYPKLENVPVHYIHGKLGDDNVENNMVLGINEYWDADNSSKHTDYNIFKKFTQRVIKNTGVDYRKWIFAAIKQGLHYENMRDQTLYRELGLSEIYIFGHSLGISDKDILKELFMHEQLIVNVFYKDKIHLSNLIASIVKMISEEEFIKQYNEYPQRICFLQQKEMQKIENMLT